jgi:hypothetical protein
LAAGGGYGNSMTRTAALAVWGVLASCMAMMLCVAVAAYAAPPASAKGGTFSVLKPTFSPDRLGARGALTFAVRYGDGEPDVVSPMGGTNVPLAVRKLVVRFPAGMGLDIPNPNACTATRLRAHGARGCSAASRVGSGYAITKVHAGTQILTERISLTAFVGPLHNGQSTLEILAKGYTPLGESLVFGGEMRFGHAPYGEELVLHVPPIPTLPEEPDASPVLFSLTLGVNTNRRSRSANTVIIPSHCPAGGFPFASESTYADGSIGNSAARVLCP